MIDMSKLITAEQKRADTIEATWEKIKAERDARQLGGSKVEVTPGVFKWFNTDPASMTQHLANARKADNLIASGGLPDTVLTVTISDVMENINWKTMDNTWCPVTAQIAQNIVTNTENMVAAGFKAAETHKYWMEQSANPSNYDYSTGWPEHFVA